MSEENAVAELKDKKVVVTYNKDTLTLINELTRINPKILIEKEMNDVGEETGNIFIDGVNTEQTIAYKFSTKTENFNFNGDEVAFYDFSDFHDLFSQLETPDIIQIDDNRFEIKKNRTKITYFISDAEAIGQQSSEIDFQDPDFTFAVTPEQIKNIRKMITLINADDVTISMVDGKVIVKLTSGDKDNSYETEFASHEECDEEISVTTEKTVWEKIPEGNYDVEVKSEGIVRFKYSDKDNVTLEIFAAENEED